MPGLLKNERIIKTEMNTIGDRIIEVEVTEEDLRQMRADGVPASELPQLGVKKYRPARHIVKDKVAILLDADIVEHFKNQSETGSDFYQKRINQALRETIDHAK